MRFATCCHRIAAPLALTLVPIGCTSSSCPRPPGPIPGVTIFAMCNVTVTLSNGFQTALSVQFTRSTAACDTDLTPSTDTLFIDAGASTPECGATTPADASGG